MKNNMLGFVIIIAMLAITSIFSLQMFLKEKTAHDKINISIFPYTIGEWKGKDLEVKEWEYKLLETRNLISRQYVNPSNKSIWLFIIYSETNRSVFHPPEMCLLGSGLDMIDKTKVNIDSKGHKISANKLYLGKDNYRELTLYCYKAGDLYTSNFYMQQAYLITHQIFGRPLAGATIRVSMPLERDEQAVLADMKDFLKESVQALESLR